MKLPLISAVEKYRAETEGEAYMFIEEQKTASTAEGFELKKASCEKKEKKEKKEIVEEYYFVTLTKNYDF